MRLIVLGSGSAGNCYILENDSEALIIECGVRFDKIKQALRFNISKVAGCLISHEDKDHCRSVTSMMDAGITCMATEGTFRAMQVPAHHHRCRVLTEFVQVAVGNFKVMCFPVEHDAEQPAGFMIEHDETGTILFVTDSYYVKYRFKGLNNILIEANYDEDIINERVVNGGVHDFLRDRIYTSHMSLRTCKELLQANDLSQVNNIVLIHLSDGNSNAEKFKNTIQASTGKTVHIASAGMIIENFHKTPF